MKQIEVVAAIIPKFHLIMHCYLCSLVTETMHLKEHEAARWLSKE